MGIKVYSLEEFTLSKDKSDKIILAMNEKFYPEVNLLLHEHGLEDNTYPSMQSMKEIQNFNAIKNFINLLNRLQQFDGIRETCSISPGLYNKSVIDLTV